MSHKGLRLLLLVFGLFTTASLLVDVLAAFGLLKELITNEKHADVVTGALTVMLIVVSIVYNTELGRVTLEGVEAERQKLANVDSSVRETLQLVRQKTLIRTVNPHQLEDFNEVFGDAVRIRAYNPPLTLLTSKDRSFRDVIFRVLEKKEGSYRAIVGTEGGDKILKLGRLWESEQKLKSREETLKKMRITSYLYAGGLHSRLDQWPIFSTDLRGLSFFIIDTPTGCRSLLYILGKPFVETFDAPDLGLVITEPQGDLQIYKKLQEMFDRRWVILEETSDPHVVSDLPLTDFCKLRDTHSTDLPGGNAVEGPPAAPGQAT